MVEGKQLLTPRLNNSRKSLKLFPKNQWQHLGTHLLQQGKCLYYTGFINVIELHLYNMTFFSLNGEEKVFSGAGVKYLRDKALFKCITTVIIHMREFISVVKRQKYEAGSSEKKIAG